MNKRIALTAIIALAALTGCTQGTTEPVAQTTQDVEPAAEQTTETKDAATKNNNVYTLKDENGTTYTLNLNPYTDELIEESNKIIAEAMAVEGDVEASELEDITEWASLTIDNTKSNMESGISYTDIKIVGDEMQYDIITNPSEYFEEMTSDYQTSTLDDTDAYNHIVDISNEWLDASPATLKPGVKHTYPIVLAMGLPETIDTVWCWDQEMK